MAGPRVDVYVGKEKKHYCLPKLLLCYHSAYFDRCFNGGFKEAETQRLELPEDCVVHFENLLEYMLYGKMADSLKLILTVRGFMNFFAYADKYGLNVGDAVCDPLQSALDKKGVVELGIIPADVELVFRVCPAGSPLRTLTAKGALSAQGFMGNVFKEQELKTAGFAIELLTQMREHSYSFTWNDPFKHKARKD